MRSCALRMAGYFALAFSCGCELVAGIEDRTLEAAAAACEAPAGSDASCGGDNPCDIYFFDQASGHCYRFLAGDRWYFRHEAQAVCVAWGGHLAAVSSAAEQRVVETVVGMAVIELPGFSLAWLGGSQEVELGEWTWATGEPFEYTHWGSGQPDDVADELCMGADPDSAAWHDRSCGAGNKALCERP